MRYLFLCSLLLMFLAPVQAANYNVPGIVKNKKPEAIAGASVALLFPNDSTLAAFAVSSADGSFVIRSVNAGTYLLQVSALGYYSFYRQVRVPEDAGSGLGVLELEDNEQGTMLKGVIISGERVPLRIKGDTIEYNAGSFRVQPNAVTEDLLRQLPGMQVDQNGNIKAMGKDVSKVLVDGKEFFGNDPKVATKNLPADAIDKIQTYSKHSDRSEFTGIDDGQRNQTINLILKEGKKAGYFGDVHAGGGTGDHYDAGGKLFRFREKKQFAAMGMLNNINKFGFSINDYINFSGGMSGMMNGERRISISSDDNIPLDFGQPQSGDIGSGALGLNYTYEPRKNNRFNTSYMGSGVQKFLQEQLDTRNFLPGQVYRSDEAAQTKSNNMTHMVSSTWRNDIDSMRQLTMSAGVSLSQGNTDRNSIESAFRDSTLWNKQQSTTAGISNRWSANGSWGYVQKRKGKWKLFQAVADLGYEHKLNNNDFRNRTNFYDPVAEQLVQQYQDHTNTLLKASVSPSIVRSMGKNYYLVPALQYGLKRDDLNRSQGIAGVSDGRIDSLSPLLRNMVHTAGAGLSLKRTLTKTQWNATLNMQQLWMTPTANGNTAATREYRYLLPSLFWRHDIGPGQNASISYTTKVETPLAEMLLPVTDYSNPLYRVSGNPGLRPEYQHDLHLDYSRFDQFTMTSFFVYFNGSYTRDKINYARYVRPDLSQDLRWVNTDYESRLTLSANYARPIRPLGVELSLTATEGLDNSVSPVNDVSNINTTWSHELELGLSNKGNKVWNIRGGGSVKLSDSRYSLNKELNNTYFNYTSYLHITWQPDKHWLFLLHGDLSYYTARSFDRAVSIPLIRAEVSRFILPNQRGTITLSGFDLLDKNTSLLRSSQMNYLLQRSSNIIQRYFMLTLTYKLNKAGKAPGMF